ncbi:hypothetical protein BGZ82_005386 [Podila clonocystis]|nr:hypothetical protein BGZ82_005386 [Podila clonocystis]
MFLMIGSAGTHSSAGLGEKGSSEGSQAEGARWDVQVGADMLEKIWDFKTRYGTLGDLIDATPKEVMSSYQTFTLMCK